MCQIIPATPPVWKLCQEGDGHVGWGALGQWEYMATLITQALPGRVVVPSGHRLCSCAEIKPG